MRLGGGVVVNRQEVRVSNRGLCFRLRGYVLALRTRGRDGGKDVVCLWLSVLYIAGEVEGEGYETVQGSRVRERL